MRKRRRNTPKEIENLKRVQASNPDKLIYTSWLDQSYKERWWVSPAKQFDFSKFDTLFYSLKHPKAPVIKF